MWHTLVTFFTMLQSVHVEVLIENSLNATKVIFKNMKPQILHSH